MTIIIAYKNNPTDLAVLLTQLQQQREKPACVFLADNSPDGSGFAIAKRYHFDDSIPFAIQRNVGSIHKSWNTGIEFAQEDDVIILNDDCLVPWDFIDVLSAYAKSNGAMMYCPGNVGFPPVEATRKGYRWYSDSELSYRILDHQEHVLPPSITGWCMVIPHSTIEQIGTFDDKLQLYFGDKDYEARIFNAGGKVVFIDGLFVQHYGSSSSRKMNPKKHENIYKADEAYFKKKHKIKAAEPLYQP
jgi:GT2 family glycosyltransferase